MPSKKKLTFEEDLERRASDIISVWGDRLMLHNWDLTLVVGPTADSDHLANITWTPYYKSARLVVNSKHGLGDAAYQDGQLERTLVHELCHLLLAPYTDVYDSELNAEGVLFKLFHRGEEAAVENMTAALLEAYHGSSS